MEFITVVFGVWVHHYSRFARHESMVACEYCQAN